MPDKSLAFASVMVYVSVFMYIYVPWYLWDSVRTGYATGPQGVTSRGYISPDASGPSVGQPVPCTGEGGGDGMGMAAIPIAAATVVAAEYLQLVSSDFRPGQPLAMDYCRLATVAPTPKPFPLVSVLFRFT